MVPAAFSDQEPFTAWLRRGLGQNRIFIEVAKLYPPHGAGDAMREQSRQHFGRSRGSVERQRRLLHTTKQAASLQERFAVGGSGEEG